MIKYKKYTKKQYTLKSAIINSIIVLICSVLIFFSGLMMYCNIFLKIYPVSQVSMMPYINPNGIDEDYVYATSNTKNITHRDIVICKHDEILIIKRVIAMPGDSLMIKENKEGNYRFYIDFKSQGNFVELDEDYLKDKTVYNKSHYLFYNMGNKTFKETPTGEKYIKLGEDEIFLAGDNRNKSSDCITYGPAKTKDLVGEVAYIIHGTSLRITQVFTQFLGFKEWK